MVWMLIRDLQLADVGGVVEVLRLNNQYDFPEVDGPEAMRRVRACTAAVFLVCEVGDEVVGVVRGNYDGSRAIIHQLSVHPAYQRRGIGAALVREIVKRFSRWGRQRSPRRLLKKACLSGGRSASEKQEPSWLATGDRASDG